MVAVNEVTIDVILNGKKAQMGMKQFAKEMKKFENIGKKTNSVFKNFFKIAGIGAFAKMTLDATQLGRSIGFLAERTGIATSKIMGMRTAFSAVGGDAKAIDRTLSTISRGLAGLSMGDGEMASKLSAMNISAWDSNGQVKTADVIRGDIAEWTKRQLDAGRTNEEVATYLEKTLGIAYDEFKMLSLGREGMAKREAELIEQVGTINERQRSNLDELFLTFNKFKTTLTSLVQQVAGDVAPVFSFFGELLQTLGRGLQDVWNDLASVYRDIIGDGEELSVLLDGLKTAIGAVVDGLRFLVKWVVGPILYGFKALGEWIGKFVAFLEDKMGWFFSSPREKERQRDAELATQAFNNKDLTTQEDRLKWLSQQGSLYWKDQYDKYLEDKDLNNVQVVWGEPLDGTELMKASNSGKDTFVDVSVDNNWIENPDGTYTIMTDIDVDSSDGSSFTTNISKALNGGHA